MKKRKKSNIQQNNAGFTLVEMVVTFAILALFMVAVTKVISYTVMLYHSTQASANGLEISNIISNKVIGIVENGTEVEMTDDGVNFQTGSGYAKASGISVVDENGNKMVILPSANKYIDFRYIRNIPGKDGGEPTLTTGIWNYDDDVYMGYIVKELYFEKGLSGYPENVVKMGLTIHNGKYGDNDYSSEYYMKLKDIKEPSSE